MKKTVAFFVSLCMALVLIAVPVYGAEDRPIRVMVDGAELAFDVDPVIENDRTLVPMRLIFEALGAKVDWDEATRTALAVKGDVKISITIDSAELMKNGTVQFLTVQQPYQMGYQGFEAAVKTLNGEELAHETVDTGCTVVPAEKMEEEEMQRLLFPLDYIGQ